MDQHTHEWQPTEPHDLGPGYPGYECTSCDATTPGCSECDRPMATSLTVCHPCLDKARKIVTDVAEWIRTYEFGVQLVNLRAVRYDRDRITTSNDETRLPFGLDQIIDDPEDTRISAVKNPTDAVAYLVSWAEAWADTRTDTAPDDALHYLAEHTLWAIQNKDDSGWDTYIHEARQVRSTVRRLLGIAPVPEPVPCVHCGGRITRDWTKTGLDDTRRCQGCGMEWANGGRLEHTNTLVLHQLPTTHPDTLVTTEQARRIYPQLHPATLRKWVQRGHLEPHDHDVRGVPMYRLGDITERIDTKTTTTGGSAA